MTSRRVVVVGDVMVDYHLHVAPAADEKVTVTHSSRELGGTGANAAAVLTGLGHRPRLCAAMGDDPAAMWVVSKVVDAGISAAGLTTVPGDTGHATIVHRATGREVFVDKGVVLDVPTPTQAVVGDALVYVSYAPRVVVDLVSAGMGHQVVAGIEDWMVTTPGLADALSAVGVVVTNQAGADRLRAEGIVAHAPWVVTRGDKGVTLEQEGRDTVEIPAVRVDAVDPTGAGDCFAGVFVAGLAEGLDLAAAAHCAVKGAALSTTAVGAQGYLPTRSDVGLAGTAPSYG